MAVNIQIILNIKRIKQTIIAIIQTFMYFHAILLKINNKILPPHLNLVP